MRSRSKNQRKQECAENSRPAPTPRRAPNDPESIKSKQRVNRMHEFLKATRTGTTPLSPHYTSFNIRAFAVNVNLG